MLKKTLFAITLAGLSCSAFAQVEMSAGYVNLSADTEYGTDISVSALAASIGYEFPMSETFKLVPEFRVGFGIGDDTFEASSFLGSATVTTELDSYYGAALRAVFETTSGVYLFAVPSFTKAKFEFSDSTEFNGVIVEGDSGSSTSDWEAGIGAGVGFQLSEFIGVEAAYEKIDETDFMGIHARFAF